MKKWVSLFAFVLLVVACQKQLEALGETAVPTNTAAPAVTALPTDIPLEPQPVAALGAGVFSGYGYSPDGSLFAYVANGDLYWYDAGSLELLGEVPSVVQPGKVYLYFSGDNRYLFVGSLMMGGGSVVDIEEQRIASHLSGQTLLRAAFSPDDRYVGYVQGVFTNWYTYSLVIEELGTRRSFSPDFSTEQHTIFLEEMDFSKPAFSPDGRLVAAGISNDNAYIWDLETEELVQSLPHAAFVRSLAFSLDGAYLVTGSMDGLVRIWDVGTGDLLDVIGGLPEDIYQVRYLHDGTAVEIQLLNGDWYTWDLAGGALSLEESEDSPNLERDVYGLGYLSIGSDFSKVQLNAAGTLAAYGDRNILLWNLETQQLAGVLQNPVGEALESLAFRPDGRQLAAGLNNGDVLLWNLDEKGYTNRFTGQDLINERPFVLETALDSDSFLKGQLAYSTDSSKLAYVDVNTITIIDPASQQTLAALPIGHPDEQRVYMSFSNDGSRLYVILDDSLIAQTWDLEHETLVQAVVIPDSRMLVSSVSGGVFAFVLYDPDTEQNRIEVWDFEQGSVRVIPLEETVPETIAFSSDGSMVAALDSDNRMSFWLVESGELVYSTDEPFGNSDALIQSIGLNLSSQLLTVPLEDQLSVYTIAGIAAHAEQLTEEASPIPEPTLLAEIAAPAAEVPSGYADYPLEELGRSSNGVITSAAWAPGGSRILITSSQGVYRYDPVTLQLESRAEPGIGLDSAVAAQNGDIFAAGANKGVVQVWDTASQEVIASIPGYGRPALSPDASQVVSLDIEGELYGWRMGSAERLHFPSASPWKGLSWAPVPAPHVVYSPDGAYLAAVQVDGSVRVWDSQTGTIVNGVSVPDGNVRSVQFSADSQYIICAGGSYLRIFSVVPTTSSIDIRVYPKDRPEEDPDWLKPDNHRVQAVTAAALSPDGRYAAAGTGEGLIMLYDLVENSTPIKLEGHTNVLNNLAFNPDGTKLLSVDADGSIFVWQVPSGRIVTHSQMHGGEIEGLVFRVDGNLTAWSENTALTLSSRDAGLLYTTHIYSGTIYAVSPDDGQVAVYNPLQMEVWNKDGQFLRTLNGEVDLLFTRSAAVEDLFAANFSADGRLLAVVGSTFGRIYNSGVDPVFEFPPFAGYLSTVGFSPDGRLVYTCLPDLPYVRIIELESGEEIQAEFPYSVFGSWRQIRFSADSGLIGSVISEEGEPSVFVVWNVSDGSQVNTVTLPDAVLESLAFSPDGRLAAVGADNGEIYIIDLQNWTVLGKAPAHTGAVTQLAFSADGRTLASGSADGTVKLWGIP